MNDICVAATAVVSADPQTKTGHGWVFGFDVKLSARDALAVNVDLWRAPAFDVNFGSESQIRLVSLGLMHYWPGRTVRPFVTAGVGGYRTDFQFESRNPHVGGPSNLWAFGGYGGGGLDLGRSAVTVRVFTRYHFVGHLVGNASGSFLEAGAGLRYGF